LIDVVRDMFVVLLVCFIDLDRSVLRGQLCALTYMLVMAAVLPDLPTVGRSCPDAIAAREVWRIGAAYCGQAVR
jgi:hypothetical protein